jgi:hypothetical protein
LGSPIDINVFWNPSSINGNPPGHPMSIIVVEESIISGVRDEGLRKVLNLIEIFLFNLFALMAVVDVE